ncbi:YncE family protein [Streptomyces sp. NPDC102476]|uniref:YncE family protein n=1 Tax=Streptomyces sp. NPDC102476 TaxID=3366181 RepID=UPI003817CAC5
MKSARFSPSIAASVVGALLLGMTAAAVVGPGAVDSYAASGTALPIAHFAHLVVDAPHGHLYISGGAGTDGILVTDLDGGNATTISGEQGATGLALSADGTTLYAALPYEDAIAAISTADLTESARYGTGAGTHPDSPAVAGGTLWFGYGTAGAGGIGSVDGAGTVTLRQDSGSWAGPPTLATTPTPSGVLAAATQTGDTSAFVTYQAQGGALTRQAAKALPVPDLSDFAVTADGQHLAVSSWANPSDVRYRTSDLSVDGRFAMPVAAKAVAVAPDGTLAGCACNGYEFEAFPETGEGFYREYGFDYPLRLAAHGLAWAPDESRLYGVAVDASGGTPTLTVVRTPETAPVRLLGSATDQLAPGETYAFRAGFDAPLSLGAGESMIPGTVRITRYDDTDPDGVLVPDPTATPARSPVDFFGSYQVVDTAPLTGPLSFRVDYSGGGHYGPAVRTFDVPVAKYAPTIALTGPDTGGRAAPLTVTGRLGWPHAHVRTGAVHVVKSDLAHPRGYSVGAVPVAADGTFAVHDTPQTGGANTYSVTYDGGTSYLPVTASQTVQVSRATPGLSVTTDAKSYRSGATVKITAHLGTTYNSRLVTLYAQPAGKSRTVLKSGKVDAHGNLVASYKITRNTVFSAAFAGDYRYAPRTVTTGATLTPTVRTQLQYPLRTTRIGSTTYQVFYKSEVNLGFNLQVTPRQAAGCTSVYVERYSSGAWHQVTSQKCVPLYSDGWYGYVRALKLFTSNDRYRVRGLYTPPAKGAQTGSVRSGWTYFTVRPGSLE